MNQFDEGRTRTPLQRFLGFAGIWAAVVAFMLLSGHIPEFALVTLVVGVVATVMWLFTDVSVSVETANWATPSKSALRGRGRDSRASVLHRQLYDLDNRQLGASRREMLATTLLTIIDDRVAAAHGVSRAEEPERFRQIVGPELAAFVASVEAGRPTFSTRALPALLSRIEQL